MLLFKPPTNSVSPLLRQSAQRDSTVSTSELQHIHLPVFIHILLHNNSAF
jgi:hypothetical protein